MLATARSILLFLGGLLMGISLMLGDELINFAQCCNGQEYPFPLIGAYSIWTSWEIAFSGIVLGAFLALAAKV